MGLWGGGGGVLYIMDGNTFSGTHGLKMTVYLHNTEAGWCQVRKYFIWRPPLNNVAAAT